jgi:cysteine sulfinate desulfinase/cysteine desulfurase-like protein
MKRVDNEQGVALVTSLLLTLISLAITMALLTFILAGTRMSASQKRYHNALSAAYGGIEVSTRDLIPKVFNGFSSNSLTTSFSNINLAVHSSNACLQQKLFLRSSEWNACGDLSAATKPDAAVAPDVRFTLQGVNNQSDFNIAAKIVDTVPGNSDPSGTEMLDAGMAVAGTSPGVSPMHLPSLITIEVEGTQGSKPQEKADLSVLYAY